MSTPDDMGAAETQATPAVPADGPKRIGIFDVIDQFGLGYYEGRALEGILHHRLGTDDWISDLQTAQGYLEELKNRLRAQGGTS